MSSDGVSRRLFFGRTAAASVASVLASPLASSPAEAAAGENAVRVTVTINGQRRTLTIDPRVTLLDGLHERLNLTGTKKGCDRGQCGACTVHVDGRRMVSCLTLAASLDGKAVTTIEGLAGDDLHPVQRAFIDSDGYHCGFCTSGQVMSAVAVLRAGQVRNDAEIREAVSGQHLPLRRYANIVDAIKQAKGKS